MRQILKSTILASAALGLLAAPAAGARERMSGEEKLAKMLEGRVAGEPRSCVDTFHSRNFQVIDETALVLRSGGTLWVNIPRNAEDLDDDDILVTRQFGSQLCRLDSVTTLDRGSQMFNGVLFLGDFVPYRKADS